MALHRHIFSSRSSCSEVNDMCAVATCVHVMADTPLRGWSHSSPRCGGPSQLVSNVQNTKNLGLLLLAYLHLLGLVLVVCAKRDSRDLAGMACNFAVLQTHSFRVLSNLTRRCWQEQACKAGQKVRVASKAGQNRWSVKYPSLTFRFPSRLSVSRGQPGGQP